MIRDIGLCPYYYWSNTLKFDDEWDKDIIAEVVIEEFQQVESNGQITFNLDGKVLSAEYRPRWN